MGLFRKANKAQAKLRLALIGPAGSGKTYSALAVGTGLLSPGRRIAVIDTEHGSSEKYAGEFDFDVMTLSDFHPNLYIEAITAAENEGYEVVIVDSLSHAWMGKGGELELADKAAARYRNNSFAGWKDVTPLHNALIDKIVRCRSHLVATMRSKTDYVLQQTDRGSTPVKVGMAPIQREGMDFEFDIAGDLDVKHQLIISKTRCKALDNAVIRNPGRGLADTLKAWLSDGTPDSGTPAVMEAAHAVPAPPAVPMGHVTPEQVKEIEGLASVLGMTPEQIQNACTRRGAASLDGLTSVQAGEIIDALARRADLAQSAGQPADPPSGDNAAKAAKGLYPFQEMGDAPAGMPSRPELSHGQDAEGFTMPGTTRPDKGGKPAKGQKSKGGPDGEAA